MSNREKPANEIFADAPYDDDLFWSSVNAKIGLRLCHYVDSTRIGGIDSNDRLIVDKGWIVTSLYGEDKSQFVIPMTYRGLPIVGVHYAAYEKLKNSFWNGGTITIYLGFYSDTMRFIMPPHRYKNRTRVEVNYRGESHYRYANRDNNGYFGREIKNDADSYYGVAFISDRHYGPLADLAAVTHNPVNGYSFYARLDWERERRFYAVEKTYGCGLVENPERIVGRYKERTEISLIQSTRESMKRHNVPIHDGSGSTTDVECRTFDDLGVGQSYSLPVPSGYLSGSIGGGRSIIRDYMEKTNTILAFYDCGLKPTNELDFAYNLIPGEEEVVDSSAFAMHRVV